MPQPSVIGTTPSPATHAIPPWRVQPSEIDPSILIIQHCAASNPQPANWAHILAVALRAMPGTVLVAAKRLSSDSRIFSMGEFVIHPKGFHHLGQGLDASAYRFPEEVDAVVGGVFAVHASALESQGGIEALQGQLGLLSTCLALRAAGGRCVVLPQAVVTDTTTPQPDTQEQQSFERRWGFNWLAADLATVQQQYADTGLLWNIRFHAQAMPFEKYTHRPALHWTSYQQVQVYRQRADHLAKLAHQLCPTGPILDLGCGDGLFTHLFASHCPTVLGVDPEPLAIQQAQTQTAAQVYPGPRPRFLVGQGESLPLGPNSVRLVTMLDVIEHLPNPVAVLRQAARVLAPDGHLLVTTPAWQFGHWSDPVYHVCEYTLDELCRQIQAATNLTVVNTGKIGGVYRDLIVIARKA